jgi:hypothetical protein
MILGLLLFLTLEGLFKVLCHRLDFFHGGRGLLLQVTKDQRVCLKIVVVVVSILHVLIFALHFLIFDNVANIFDKNLLLLGHETILLSFGHLECLLALVHQVIHALNLFQVAQLHHLRLVCV